MTFSRLASRNLLRRKTRTALTVLGIAVSTAVLFSILSFNKGFDRGLSREIERTGIHFMVVPSGCAHEVASLVLHGAVIPKFLDTGVMDSIRRQEGVELATPILVAQLPNPEKDRIDLIYGVETSLLPVIKPGWKIDGRVPSASDEILLGDEVAKHHGAGAGGEIVYSGINRRFRVSGVVGSTGSQDDAFIYMPIATAQAIIERPSGATAIGVKAKNPESLQKITDDLSRDVPGIQIVTMNQVVSSISNLAASAKVLSLSISFIAILISAVGAMNSILTAVFERTQEIGMMRAIGASRADIFRMILGETTIISAVGGALGIFASTAGNDLIEILVKKFMPYVPTGDMVAFEPEIAAASLAFIFAVGILSGVYPAWKASGINPIEAIKG